MVYAQPSTCPREWHTQTPMGFDVQTDHLISARRQNNNNKKKEHLQNCRLCCPGWPQNKPESMYKG